MAFLQDTNTWNGTIGDIPAKMCIQLKHMHGGQCPARVGRLYKATLLAHDEDLHQGSISFSCFSRDTGLLSLVQILQSLNVRKRKPFLQSEHFQGLGALELDVIIATAKWEFRPTK